MDAVGKRFGRLLVLKILPMKTKNAKALCECRCGNKKIVDVYRVRTRSTKSCGCLNHKLKHGRSKTPEFGVWRDMRLRCFNPDRVSYPNYGGRGISVCPRWDKSFRAFLSDMGERPTPKHSIERIDNDGDYKPSNCRWATRIEQASNQRTNRLITAGGVTKTLTQWSRDIGVCRSSIANRIKYGMPPELAVYFPKHPSGIRIAWR